MLMHLNALQRESLEDALRQLFVLDAIDANGEITGGVGCWEVGLWGGWGAGGRMVHFV